MALLSFPPAPNNGDLFPLVPVIGQNQYQWDDANQTWVLLGSATGVAPGCYGDATNVASFCVDTQGRITSAVDVPIPAVTPDLQTVTTQGAITTDTIDVGGLVAAGLSYPTADGAAGDVLTTDGAGALSFVAFPIGDLQTVTDNGSVTTNPVTVASIVTTGNGGYFEGNALGNIQVVAEGVGGFGVHDGTTIRGTFAGNGDINTQGSLTASGLSYPIADGAAGEVLTTDGAGNLGWASTLKVVAPPTASTDPGNPGEVSAAPGFFYFYDGTQWLQVAGSIF